MDRGELERRGAGRGTYYVLPRRPAAHRPSTQGDTDPDSERPRDEVVAELERELISLSARIQETGVSTQVLSQLLEQNGAVSAVQTLLRPGAPGYGFAELWQQGRLDLTVETLVVGNDHFARLFGAAAVERAAGRLANYGFEM